MKQLLTVAIMLFTFTAGNLAQAQEPKAEQKVEQVKKHKKHEKKERKAKKAHAKKKEVKK